MERMARHWTDLEPTITFSAGIALYEGQDPQDCQKSADLMLL